MSRFRRALNLHKEGDEENRQDFIAWSYQKDSKMERIAWVLAHVAVVVILLLILAAVLLRPWLRGNF